MTEHKKDAEHDQHAQHGKKAEHEKKGEHEATATHASDTHAKPTEEKSDDDGLPQRTKDEQAAGRKALEENNARVAKVEAERAKAEAENPPPKNTVVNRPGIDTPPHKPAA